MTLLIKNVRVLGGTKDFDEPTDVFVVGEKISAIGSFPQKSAETVLDGQGAYLSPGFIDVGSTADRYLDIFEDPAEKHLLSQGITTVIGGQCGFSLAPLLYGRLDMFRKWTDTDKVNVNWHTVKEFFANLAKLKLGVNFATLTGHSTIRQDLLGDTAKNLTLGELAVFKKVVRDSLADGSAGISFGLEYSHGKSAPFKEIKILAELVSAENGVCAIHLRHRDREITQAFSEARSLAESVKVKVLINHFSPLAAAGAEYEKVLAEIQELPPHLELYFSVRPFEENIIPLYFMLPEWARKGSLEEMLRSIKDEWLSIRIAKEFPDLGPEKIIILRAVKNEILEGKNLKELMEMYGLKTLPEVLKKLMLSTGLRATLAIEELDPKLVVAAWKNSRSMLGTFSPKTKSQTTTLLHFLERVEKEKLFSLNDAVWKMSGLPAKVFGLNSRGQIIEGNFADLVAFKNGEVKFTIVNGNLAYPAGGTSKLFGKPLIHAKNGF